MNCRETQKLLSLIVDGEADKTQINAANDHISSCEACAREKRLIEGTWQLLDVLPDIEPVPHFYTRLMAKIRSERKTRPAWHERLWIPASVTIAAVLGIMIGSMVGENSEMAMQQPIAEEEVVDMLYLESFQDFPDASTGDALFSMVIQE